MSTYKSGRKEKECQKNIKLISFTYISHINFTYKVSYATLSLEIQKAMQNTICPCRAERSQYEQRKACLC